ncbi:MAG: hypothetical protein ACN6OV_13375 [Acinetobacter sp.]|uniref:hypothetical protein n=1 Tax=Acinetobacter sp. TaxID=472 RepID=UPI003CFFECD6
MKWSKILLIIVLVLVVLGVIVFTLKPEKTSSSSVKQNNQNEQGYEDGDELKSSGLNGDSKAANKVGGMTTSTNNEAFLDMSELRKKYPDGVRYLNIDSSDLSLEQKEMFKKDFENLAKYGSFDGNAPDQNEFKEEDLAKLRKMINKQEALSFSPMEENRFVPNDLKMTGKYYSGTYNEKQGFDSYTRLYENSSNGEKIEISEMYLNPSNNTVLDVFKESRNADLDGVSMTWQTKPNSAGNNYTADFVINQKKYSISTAGYSESESKQIVSNLIKANR